MAIMSSPAPAMRSMSMFACIRCSERKVGCDKQNPCTACVRHNVPCIFRPPKESRKRRKIGHDGSLDERLKRYEALLRQKGIDPDQVNGTAQRNKSDTQIRSESAQNVRHITIRPSVLDNPERGVQASQTTPKQSAELPQPPWKLPPQAPIFKPQLRHGKNGTELVDNLWSRIAEEIHEPHNRDAAEEDSASDVSDDDFNYVLGGAARTKLSHPPAETVHQLWQTFVDNVDPLTKLVHVPSLSLAIEKAMTNIERVPRGFEALMFAIYSMAVLSLTDAECKDMFGDSQKALLSRYIAATKAALSRARFLSSTSIVVMQALILHIFSVRQFEEPRAVWALTGVALRIGQNMGMGLDGTTLGLSPFETEIRRRIYWQLKMHDFRAAELSGQAKMRGASLDETTPKLPANVGDCGLYPSMLQAAAESTRPTEMIWCILRFELASFAATQKARLPKSDMGVFISDEYAAFNMKNMDVFIKDMEDKIETKYLRFCDPSNPLQLMAMLGARSTANVVQFMIHHPRKWSSQIQVPESEKQLVWNIVVKLLEQYNMMQSSPQLRHFAWIVPYFIQWHAVIHILDTLRASPLQTDAVKAWKLINTLYENNLDMLLSTERPIFVAIGNLCLKAYDARAAALTALGRILTDPPRHVSGLREQRVAAKVKRKIATTKCSGQEASVINGNPQAMTQPVTNSMSGEARARSQLLQEPMPQQLGNSFDTGDDAFWLNDALSGDAFHTSGGNDTMSLNISDILAQDYWLGITEDDGVDWAQWDAWVGNVSMPANIGTG